MILVKYNNTGVMFCKKLEIYQITDTCSIRIACFDSNDRNKIPETRFEFDLGEKAHNNRVLKIKEYGKESRDEFMEYVKETILEKCYNDKCIDLDKLDGLLNIRRLD